MPSSRSRIRRRRRPLQVLIAAAVVVVPHPEVCQAFVVHNPISVSSHQQHTSNHNRSPLQFGVITSSSSSSSSLLFVEAPERPSFTQPIQQQQQQVADSTTISETDHHNALLQPTVANGTATTSPASVSSPANSLSLEARTRFFLKPPKSLQFSRPIASNKENEEGEEEEKEDFFNNGDSHQQQDMNAHQEEVVLVADDADNTFHLPPQPHQPWTSDHYNQALSLMISWSHRHSRRAAIMVERIIRRVVESQTVELLQLKQKEQQREEDDDDDGDHDDALNDNNAEVDWRTESANSNATAAMLDIDMSAYYTCAIRGWANSGEGMAAALRAEEILETMQQRYMDGATNMKPGIEAFNLVLLAYWRSGVPEAPTRSLRVLGRLHEWYSSGATDVAPNKASYAAVLRAYARTGKSDAPEHVKRLLDHFKRLADEEGYTCVKPDYMCCGAYVAALVDSMDRDIITAEEAATRIEAYVSELLQDEDEEVHPDAYMFNMALAAWSKSNSYQMAERAEALMAVYEEYYERSGRVEKNQPTTLSYNFLLACYTRSISPKGETALQVLRKMNDLVESGNNTAARADAVTYNTAKSSRCKFIRQLDLPVMTALANARSRHAPYEVEKVLREMFRVYEETNDQNLRPTSRSFGACVNAWAKSDEPGAADRIMDWIVHMQQYAERENKRGLRPDKWTFNSFLQALSKTGSSRMGEEAENVLNQMEEFYEKGWIELKPDVLTFTSVVHCYAMSGADDSVEKSLAIVRRMEDLHERGFGDVRPNAYTYNCVINAAAKAKRAGKAQIALQILRRMQDVAIRPPTVTYNNVLNACGFANHPDDHPEDIMDIAKEVFDEAKATCGANYITYAAYIRVARTFVKDGTRKKDLVKDAFRQCCEAGQLTNSVMKQMKYALTARQYAELEAVAMGGSGKGKYRSEYTENARLSRIAFNRRKP